METLHKVPHIGDERSILVMDAPMQPLMPALEARKEANRPDEAEFHGRGAFCLFTAANFRASTGFPFCRASSCA